MKADRLFQLATDHFVVLAKRPNSTHSPDPSKGLEKFLATAWNKMQQDRRVI